jgi:hypothetical protein
MLIPYLLYDVTGRINPRMDYAFCLLHIEEFEKWRSPLFGATGNFNHQILPYGMLFLTFISTNVFYLLSFDQWPRKTRESTIALATKKKKACVRIK